MGNDEIDTRDLPIIAKEDLVGQIFEVKSLSKPFSAKCGWARMAVLEIGGELYKMYVTWDSALDKDNIIGVPTTLELIPSTIDPSHHYYRYSPPPKKINQTADEPEELVDTEPE